VANYSTGSKTMRINTGVFYESVYLTSDTYLYDVINNEPLSPAAATGKRVIAVCDSNLDAVLVAVIGELNTLQPPTTATIAGTVLYQTSPMRARVTLRGSGGSILASGYADANGNYMLEFPALPAESSYTLTVAKAGYLSYTAPLPALGELAAIDIRQRAGDVNDDGAIDAQDLNYLRSNFNRADTQSDIDGNGVVNAVDLSYLLAGYGKGTYDILR
jgi:hypothetical protein